MALTPYYGLFLQPKTGRAWRRALVSSRTLAYRQEIQRPVELARVQAEVARADRWDEAVVEGPGDPQGAVDAVPAEPDRQLVDAQLTGVEEAEQLDAPEGGGEAGPG